MDLWHLLGAGLVGLWLGGVLAFSRVPDSGLTRSLRGFAVCASLWALGDLLASLAPDLFWKRLGLAVLYSGGIFLPPMWWMLALRWSEYRGAPLPFDLARWTRLPLLFAGAMWLAMLSNPWHGQFIVPVVGGRNLYGPLWWLMAVPSYGLILGVLAVALRLRRRIRLPDARRQAAFVVAATGLTLVANWLYVAGASGSTNATLPVLSLSGVILCVGMLREGLFGVLPVALPVITSHDPDGLLVVRPDGRLIHANPRARSMLAPVVLAAERPLLAALARRLRRPDGARLDEESPEWEESWWQAALQPGGTLFRYGREGQCWLRLSGQPVHGRGGRLLATCLRLHDATQEQRTEAELRRARRLESVAEVALGVAHDFHNLLAVVRGNAELLANQHETEPEIERKLHRILRAGEQATDLADQLHVYAGASEPRCDCIDLSGVVRDALEVFDPELFATHAGRRIDVAFDAGPRPVTIEADATQMRQIVLNLLVNARDALEEGGEIRVHTGHCWLEPATTADLVLGGDRPAGEYGYVRVSDTGSGIEPEAQERIFEPFFSTRGKHRGIGLATVFGVARSHGALLALKSRVGRGTTFTVYLPSAASEGPSQARPD